MFHTKSKTRLPYMLVAPVTLFLLLFSYLPFPYAMFLSVNETQLVTGELKFVGLKNFRIALNDPNFWESFRNTFSFVALATIFVICLGVMVALILNSKIHGVGIYMTILLIPWVVSDVVAGFSWKWLLNPDFGVLNYIFSPLGIKASNLITKPQYAMLTVVLATVWKQLAYSALLLLAGLQNVSNDLIEAAKIDGCSGWKAFWKITLPIFSPMLLVTTLLDIINFISQSGMILVLTNGGPLRSTETLALYLYKEAFANYHLTNASAISILLALINIVVVIVYLYANNKSKRWVE